MSVLQYIANPKVASVEPFLQARQNMISMGLEIARYKQAQRLADQNAALKARQYELDVKEYELKLQKQQEEAVDKRINRMSKIWTTILTDKKIDAAKRKELLDKYKMENAILGSLGGTDPSGFTMDQFRDIQSSYADLGLIMPINIEDPKELPKAHQNMLNAYKLSSKILEGLGEAGKDEDDKIKISREIPGKAGRWQTVEIDRDEWESYKGKGWIQGGVKDLRKTGKGAMTPQQTYDKILSYKKDIVRYKQTGGMNPQLFELLPEERRVEYLKGTADKEEVINWLNLGIDKLVSQLPDDMRDKLIKQGGYQTLEEQTFESGRDYMKRKLSQPNPKY